MSWECQHNHAWIGQTRKHRISETLIERDFPTEVAGRPGMQQCYIQMTKATHSSCEFIARVYLNELCVYLVY
ncbi:hypothetical protein ElyMa_006240500 [Elysia marginata]|uniref:Uncharacterized protein n=1 Tax=Elysia marginata TaxID=1093978 RepID=A0AAV4HAA4_9GAST|nr:hypothetical protein ElyMa_006240500 [Elysia marginata]